MDLTGLRRDEVADVERLVSVLSYRGGRLHLGDHPADELLREYGSPAIVFVADRIRDNVRAIHDAFAAQFSTTRTFFAAKSCYLPAVLSTVIGEGAGLEIMSALEVRLAARAGCSAGEIVSNGVARTPEYLEVITPGMALVVVDNEDDLLNVARRGEELGAPIRVGLRVSPPAANVSRYIGRSAKLGADWESGRFSALVQTAQRLPGCRLVGMHAHQLTHANDLGVYRATVRGVAEVAAVLRRDLGVEFEVIDVGGGFDSRFLLARRGLDAADFAAIAADELSRVDYDFELWIEPGRFVAADAGVGLTRATGDKRGPAGAFRYVDLGSNVLIPLPDVAYHPLPVQLPPPDARWATYDVGDATCAPSVLCRSALLPEGPEGRELAVLNCGAYTSVFAHPWAFALPRLLFLDGGRIDELVGPREHAEVLRLLYGLDAQLTPAGAPGAAAREASA